MSDHPTQPKARELTDEEWDLRVQECFALEEQIKAGLRAGLAAAWAVAKAAHEFDAMSGWTALGFESLTHWLADPDVGMRRSTWFRAVKMWQETAVLRKIDMTVLAELDISKVEIVLPALKAGRVKLDEALGDARSMGQRDLRVQYQGEPEVRPDPDPPPESLIDETPAGTGVPTLEQDACGLVMIGSGTDVYDPICELPAGHEGSCKSTSAIDQNRLGDAAPRDWEFDQAEPEPAGELVFQGLAEGCTVSDVIEHLTGAIDTGARRMLLTAAQEARAFLEVQFAHELNPVVRPPAGTAVVVGFRDARVMRDGKQPVPLDRVRVKYDDEGREEVNVHVSLLGYA